MIITGRQINELADLIEQAEGIKNNDVPTPEEMAVYLLEHRVKIIPCSIGEKVWIIRKYNGVPHAREGVVSGMYFIEQMALVINVKGIGYGKWGERVFATCEECERAIEERKKKDNVYN